MTIEEICNEVNRILKEGNAANIVDYYLRDSIPNYYHKKFNDFICDLGDTNKTSWVLSGDGFEYIISVNKKSYETNRPLY